MRGVDIANRGHQTEEGDILIQQGDPPNSSSSMSVRLVDSLHVEGSFLKCCSIECQVGAGRVVEEISFRAGQEWPRLADLC